MPNDLNDTLGKLTPSAGRLDAGALLYEAGRASVPSPWRAWAFAALLALTQTLTLLAWLPGPRERPAPGADAPGPPARPDPGADAPGSPGAVTPLAAGQLPPEPPAESLPPDRPPLRAIDLSSFD